MKNYVFMLITLFIFVSCGGSSGGSSDGTSPVSPTSPDFGLEAQVGDITGVLLDDKVTGIDYASTSHTGTTDGTGNFTCAAGETVTFSVNSLTIGSVPCLPVITPIELVSEGEHKWDEVSFSGDDVTELSASQNTKLKRLLMLMQTIDTNGDPSDGISVDSNLGTTLSGLSFSQSDMDDLLTNDSDAEFTASMNALVTGMGGSTAVANSSSAVSHFQTTLTSQTSCTTGDITGSTSVSGVTPDCVAISCSGSYSLSNGTCVAKTSCTTGDVSNSSTVTGYVEDGCSATACNSGYGLSSGMCVAMAACTTSDVSNSTAVSGYRDDSSCVATACDTGYAVSGGACVVSTASQVVSDAVDHYDANYATTGFIVDMMANEIGCTTSGSSSYATLKTLYNDNASNSFLTSGAYLQDRTCLDKLVERVNFFATHNSLGLDRDADVVTASGATDLSTSFFDVNGHLTDAERAILELLFADQ